jgi:hypothetical protein
MPNNSTQQFPNSERVWDQHFKISGFGVSNAKQKHTTIPEFRKVKGCGTNTSGYRDSGFGKTMELHKNVTSKSRMPKFTKDSISVYLTEFRKHKDLRIFHA